MDDIIKKVSWVDNLESLSDYYYYEPQHLGKHNNPDSKFKNYDEIFEHLGKLEFTLGHQLDIFFSLLPDDIITKLFSQIASERLGCKMSLYGVDYDSLMKNEMQPDMVFLNDEYAVYVELKVESKSKLQQYYKYLKLHKKIEEHYQRKLKMVMIFLTKHEFSDLFEEGFGDFDEIKKALISNYPEESEIFELSKECNIKQLNYEEFFNHIIGLASDERNLILDKMVEGLRVELQKRELIK
jgi:hypothetical protein